MLGAAPPGRGDFPAFVPDRRLQNIVFEIAVPPLPGSHQPTRLACTSTLPMLDRCLCLPPQLRNENGAALSSPGPPAMQGARRAPGHLRGRDLLRKGTHLGESSCRVCLPKPGSHNAGTFSFRSRNFHTTLLCLVSPLV
ncbi:hypothetical protein GQ53DRAFT_243256 [Thozetella sp. PMI_491]|nr:hypothetical protein GQ53DRAFT_243256 [Thozetella sp. PMI_491]